MIRILCLQHVLHEKPGLIASWAEKMGYPLRVINAFEGNAYPGIDSFDLLVILGGSMSVHDDLRFPWLKKEKQFIREAVNKSKKILGICLGAQLLAEALGGSVRKNPVTEIGFFAIRMNSDRQNMLNSSYPNKNPVVFHWHGETFDLPPGGLNLAESDACINQAFLVGPNYLGLQFHPEITEEILTDMISEDGHELIREKYIQDARMIMSMWDKNGENREAIFQLLNKFIDNQ